ncbi:secreted insulinase like peptidase [Cryptosporidium sp. chipmunk genotype I]|uniref:secreted insulinase like peptidase n=1 Tax=Cryptosporidium sp. chipmunk genotype I TaxID=1280935 RepID=UPI00351A1F99|nr:secreted insulinase like peptidase [Cryptosporidium sp. chipmunk genotype I]
MYRLISLISVVCLFFLNNNRIGSYIGSSSELSYNSHSLLELERLCFEGNCETYKYRDVYLNEDVVISKNSFNNGFTLLNIQQPFESLHSDFRIVFNGGSYSDPIELPGIRYFTLFLFSKQVNNCMNRMFKEETHANFKIKVDATSSTLTFTFLTRQANKFFDCFHNTIKNQMYLEGRSYFVEILQASEEFDTMIYDASSIEVDKLMIRMIYGSLSQFGCESLQISSIFSQSCFKSSIRLDDELPKYSLKLVNEIFKPNAMFATFIGKLTDKNLKKMLSKLTKGKLRNDNEVKVDYSKVNKANMAINNMGSNIFVRKGFQSDVLRIYIPFETEDMKLFTSNAHMFVLSILNSRHRNGISNFVFVNSFATKLSCYYYVEYSTKILYLELILTKNGLLNIPVIIESVVSYFNLMKSTVMSDRVYSEVQRLFDYHLTKSTVTLAESVEHYVSSHFLISSSLSNILASNLNTQFTRSDVEQFLSKMNLGSVAISLSISGKFKPIDILLDGNRNVEAFPIETIEPHTNIRVSLFKIDDILPNKLSSLSPMYAVDTYGLQLPNNDLISYISLPSFYSMPIFNKLVTLHKSLDIHYKYLNDSNRKTTISRTMAFKSITTAGIWFSNNKSYDKNINLELKFGLRKWSPLMEKFNDKLSAFSILTAIHIFTAALNIKLGKTLYYTNRLRADVRFVPSQTYSDIVSDPFELFLIVNAPVDYFTLIMSDISKVILSFDTYLSQEIISHAKTVAKDTLLKLYTSYSQLEKDAKIITQLVSSHHCSLAKLGIAIEKDINVELIRAVHASLFASPTIYGIIEGNLTPFHANHILNVFIESLDHEFFLLESTPEKSLEFFSIASYPKNEDGSDFLGPVPNISINTFILDVSTVPIEYRKIYTQKLDITADSSYSTAAILIGKLTVSSYVKAYVVKEALSYEISSEISSTKNVSFTSAVSIVANNFVVALFSFKSDELSTGSLTRILDENLNKSIPKVTKSCKSKSYLKKVLENIDLRDNISETKFLLSKFSIMNLIVGAREHLYSRSQVEISEFLSDLKSIPRILIATQKVSNLKAAISSLDYIPSGYKNVGIDYKFLLDNANVVFTQS